MIEMQETQKRDERVYVHLPSVECDLIALFDVNIVTFMINSLILTHLSKAFLDKNFFERAILAYIVTRSEKK